MRTFQCTCGQPLFFDNLGCLACGAAVAYDPTTQLLGAVVAAGDGTWWVAGDRRTPGPRFRCCARRGDAAQCNWLVPADEPYDNCLSCRLTRTIPILARPRNARRLLDIESAKRRMLFELQSWRLPIVPRTPATPAGLVFDLLEPLDGEPPVLTGHADGVITLNVAEADDDYRERHRESLAEPYRTVLGHLRHEIGHYYWNVLVHGTPWLEPFRALFGDERADYGAALRQHYASGAPPDWPGRCISSYAAMHPWEDWAECWAHYMHLRSTLQTVASYGLDTSHVVLRVTPYGTDVLHPAASPAAGLRFLEWINAWVVLTAVLNETARSMGQPDIYPFVMNRAVVTKLHFIQCVLDAHDSGQVTPMPAALAAGAA